MISDHFPRHQKVGSSSIESSKCVKLLGITIDNQLTFYSHILEISKKASCNTKALLRIRNYLNQKQIFFFSAYIMSPFSYLSLGLDVLQSIGTQSYSKNASKSALCRIQYFCLHNKWDNIKSGCTMMSQSMIVEIFKSLNHEIMWDIFSLRESSYELDMALPSSFPEENRPKRWILSYFVHLLFEGNKGPV